MRVKFGIAIMSAIVLPAALAFAHGGGGGGGGGGHGGGGGGFGGGHGGGFGGGHGGGWGGGGYHSGGFYSGGSGLRSSGMSAMSHGSNALGTTHTPQANFIHNNFGNNVGNGLQHSANRIGTGTMNHTLGNNSFIRANNITNTSPNHWTHSGNFNNLSHTGNLNHNFNHANNFNHNNFNHNGNFNRNNFFFFPFFGFGGWGLWGWGWPYYGWGYGYGGYPAYGYCYYGYGGNGGYGNYAAAAPVAADATNPTLSNFADQGEIDFKAGKYQAAARDWQHALLDDQKNGAIMMLLAQALFATGQYDEAAGATQAAMQMLPEDKWGVVITNYNQLYGNIQDYTDQLKALEKARDAKPDSPSLRFLIGFHFGYLGYPKHAIRELDKAMTLAPKDLGSRKVREIFAVKVPDAPPPPAAPADDAAPAGDQVPPGDKPAATDTKPVGTPS